MKGISKINPDTDEIKNYYSDAANGNLSNNNIWQILCTNDNKIIVSTVDGLNLYDEKEDKFVRILDKENELPSQYIYSVEEDMYNHIWIGTDKGLVELNEDLEIVERYENTFRDSEIYNIYNDNKGNIWVCTLGNGVFKINLEDKSVHNYKKETLAKGFFSVTPDIIYEWLTFRLLQGLFLINHRNIAGRLMLYDVSFLQDL